MLIGVILWLTSCGIFSYPGLREAPGAGTFARLL